MSSTQLHWNGSEWVEDFNVNVMGSYAPDVWNDTGVYSYFYIDFKRELQTFSLGMFLSSVLVMGKSALTPTAIENMSSGLYKIYCDISSCNLGLIVSNYKTTLLKFSAGDNVPAFAVFISITGLVSYIDLGYLYDFAGVSLSKLMSGTIGEDADLSLIVPAYVEAAKDEAVYDWTVRISAAENTHAIVFT